MKKFIIVLIAIISLFSSITLVTAVTPNLQAKFTSGEWIAGIYVRKDNDNLGRHTYQQMQFIRRQADWQWIYCIQPGVPIDDDITYYGNDSDWATVANMTQAQWKRVQLLAYYGYNYVNGSINHTEEKYYAITQVLIWQTSAPDWDVYYTDTLNGNRITRFTNEINEINQLVANHSLVPSFDNNTIDVGINETVTINDTNGVLNQFSVESSSNVTVTKNGNNLTITPTKVGDSNITLSKKDTKYDIPPIVYMNPYSQNVIAVGSYDPVYVNLNLRVYGGKVTLEKKDKDTLLAKPLGDAKLGGAIYGIYTDDNIRVGSVTTNSDGKIISDWLPYVNKTYYLKEEKASIGYELDNTKYYFTITKDNLYPIVETLEQVIRRDISLFKVYASDSTGFLIGESNVTFEFYLKSTNELYATATSNSEGYLTVNLPYGTYIGKQITSTENHYKVEDFEFTINENTPNPLYKLLANSEMKAKLKLIKIDENGVQLAIGGIKFKIKNLDTGEYVKQVVTYPYPQIIEIFETSNDGTFVLPNLLNSGNYAIEELDQRIIGYLWNQEALKFSIGENSEFLIDDTFGVLLEVKFSNKEVKGETSIQKYGEKLIIENDSFRYEEITLENVIYELYAKNDIYSYNGELKYKAGDLVDTITLDKNGFYKVEDLYLGDYCWLEKENDGIHVLDNEYHCFSLEYQDQYTEIISQSFTFKNYLVKGKLEFTKTDLVSGEPISDVGIEIYDENDNLIFSGFTDSNGKIIIDNLFAGKFYIIERSTKDESYILSDEIVYFEIKENGEIVRASMTNQKIVIEVPNTSTNENYLFIGLGLVSIVGGAIIILYDKKRKK